MEEWEADQQAARELKASITPAYKVVPCGRCGQPVGTRCKTLNTGRTTETHSVRLLDAGQSNLLGRGIGSWFTKETKGLSIHVPTT